MPRGGERTPRNPAPASGPGRLSRRTDGMPGQKIQTTSGGAYGDRQALANQERSAPMAQAAAAPPVSIPTQNVSPGGTNQPQLTPLDAPTQRPDEPVTHGADTGPGGDSSVMGLSGVNPAQGTGTMTALLQKMAPQDATGILAQLMQSAAARNA